MGGGMIDDKKKPRRLGKGLSAIFGDDEPDAPAAEATPTGTPPLPRSLPTSYLTPGRYQPRRRFEAEAMEQLITSVREQGVVQPLIVRPLGDNRYEIVAGERRWRAAQAVQLHEVPVVIRDMTDRQALEVSLLENIQRQDLTPLEEADGYRRLMDEFGHTQEALANHLGKSRSHIANTLRLLNLPESVRELVESGSLSAGHARALLTLPNPEAVAEQIIAKKRAVRAVEQMAQRAKDGKPLTPAPVAKPRRVKAAAGGAKDPDTLALEADLSHKLGVAVEIVTDGEAGQLVLHYATLEQLDDLLQRIG